jgi:hypothetical protein
MPGLFCLGAASRMSVLGPGCVKTRQLTFVMKFSIAAGFAEEQMIQSGVLRSNEIARCR